MTGLTIEHEKNVSSLREPIICPFKILQFKYSVAGAGTLKAIVARRRGRWAMWDAHCARQQRAPGLTDIAAVPSLAHALRIRIKSHINIYMYVNINTYKQFSYMCTASSIYIRTPIMYTKEASARNPRRPAAWRAQPVESLVYREL